MVMRDGVVLEDFAETEESPCGSARSESIQRLVADASTKALHMLSWTTASSSRSAESNMFEICAQPY